MKKIFLAFFCIFLVSCGENSEIQKAKNELLHSSGSIEEPTQDSQTPQKEEFSYQNTQHVKITAQSEKQFLEFDEIPESSLGNSEIEISGKAMTGVTSIEVTFSNPTSNFSQDSYVLQTYQPENGKFVYRASGENQVLDYGENRYVFTAKGKEGTSVTTVMINIEKREEEKETQTGSEQTLIGEENNLLSMNFPTSTKYGEPIRLGEASLTYSGIKGFELQKKVFTTPTCDTLTEFLTENMGGYFYWNMCRDIVLDKGISFMVLRLEGEKYVYEKQYLDFEHGLYGVYELETGTGINKDNLAEKNTEFKGKEFPSIQVVDGLMKDIVNL